MVRLALQGRVRLGMVRLGTQWQGKARLAGMGEARSGGVRRSMVWRGAARQGMVGKEWQDNPKQLSCHRKTK